MGFSSLTEKDSLKRSTMLYMVGLGLADETDITVKGFNIVTAATRVYLEAYTSILLVDKEKLVGSLRLRGVGTKRVGSDMYAVGSLLWPFHHLGRP